MCTMCHWAASRVGARQGGRALLTGDNFFVVLHETSESEMAAVLRVGHFLQAGQSGVGLHAVQLVQAAGQTTDGGAPTVAHAAR